MHLLHKYLKLSQNLPKMPPLLLHNRLLRKQKKVEETNYLQICLLRPILPILQLYLGGKLAQMGWGSQCNIILPMSSLPHSSGSINPFDLGSEAPPVQNQPFPSMASLQGALPNVPPPSGLERPSSLGTPSSAWMSPQSLPYASGMPLQSLPYASSVPQGPYPGAQSPNNLPLSRILHNHIIFNKMPNRFGGAVSQDWEPVVLHKSKPKAQELRDRKAVNQALRSGAPVQTIKKFDAGSNKKAAVGPVVYARKLDEQTEPAALDRVPADVRLSIQKARLEKKMSQAELAKLINEQLKVVQEYENGKAVPNHAVLAKMERILGVKLRGKTGK